MGPDRNDSLSFYFAGMVYDISEPIIVSDIWQVIKMANGVLDVISVEVVNKSGTGYFESPYLIEELKTADGMRIIAPSNTIFEMRFPISDVRGTVI